MAHSQQYGNLHPSPLSHPPRSANLHQHHPLNQQYYPTSAFIQPQPAPNQHGPHLAQAPPSFMPPPSLPDGRRILQPQRPNWPRELSEEQRQIQDQYTQNAQKAPINPYYAQPPSTSGAPVASIASFTPPPGPHFGGANAYPPQQTESRATSSLPAPSMTTTSLPPAAPSAESSAPGATSSPTPGPGVQQSVEAPSASDGKLPPSSSTQSQQPTALNPTVPKPQPPSPFEAQRVTALLEINRFLLVELNFLQSGNSAPLEPPSNDPTKAPQPRPNQPSAPHYVDYMRRLQSNLAYLASVADRPHKPLNPVPAWPAIMDPPVRKSANGQSGAEESDAQKGVREMYEGLRELWPEWKPKEVS